MKYLKLLTIGLLVVFVFSVGLSQTTVYATPVGPTGNGNTPTPTPTNSFVAQACNGLAQISNTAGCPNGSTDTLKNIVKTVVQIMSFVIGALAVIMIIVAGIKFVTAGGDTNAVSSARNTLIYALVGLFIAVLAQLLIHYTLNTANQFTGYLKTPYSRHNA